MLGWRKTIWNLIPKKFELLQFGTVDEAKDSTIYEISSGEIIQEKNSLRDLGITMSNDMRFDTHIEINRCSFHFIYW